ncbi:MAG: hypothetical protein AMXMBFR64_57440 [Myxococcales bacterium]
MSTYPALFLFAGLTTPGIVECWSRVVAWAPLPEPPEVPA